MKKSAYNNWKYFDNYYINCVFLWVISCGMGLIDCNDQIAEPVECVCFPDNFKDK